MIRIIRKCIAKHVLARTPQEVNENIAKRWNHCQAIILTHGRIKIDWYIIFGLKKIKCKRCLKKIKEEGHCVKCKRWIDEKNKGQPKRRRRKNPRKR